MNDLSLELSAERRALLRDAIKTHPAWPGYRIENDTDMAQMTTKEALFKCCDALAIDMHAVLHGVYVPPQADEEAPKPKRERKPAQAMIEPVIYKMEFEQEKQRGKPENARQTASMASTQEPLTAASLLEQALKLIASQASAPVDMDQVRAEIDARLNEKAHEIANALIQALVQAIEGLRTTLLNPKPDA